MEDDYIDELNWYTGDFEVPRSKYEKKKETKTKTSKTDHTDIRKKEKRSRRHSEASKRRHGETSKHSSRNKLINVLDYRADRSKDLSTIFKTDKRIIRIQAPEQKSLKSSKPDVKLYEPTKSLVRIRESETDIGPPLKISKNVKSDYSSVKHETRVDEPVISGNIVKTSISNKALDIFCEKLALLEERDKLIRSSMEKPSNLKQARAIRGTCPDMCPEKERIMRSFKKMVSVYECLPNSNEMCDALAVKEYARSSADQEEPLPHDLRPEPVLTMAMSYIITRIITKFEECEDVSTWYDFCWNRLRAIRKDIVQQQLCDLETVTIVEQCARFHIICFDRFWGLETSIFDEKINTENLMNCLKILLNLYGDLRKQGVVCPNEPEFNAYMILIKINSGDILWEYLNFPLSLQQTPEVIEAVRIHMFYNNNMYSQFFNYLVKTTYLNACLMHRCFTQLRVKALEAIVKAYCPPGKEGKVSLQHVMKSLKFDIKEDAVTFCRSCNIKYVERVGFKISHTTFIRPDNPIKIKTPSSLVCNKRIEFAQAVVGIYNDMPIYVEHTVHNSFLNDKALHPDALDASDQEEKMLRDNVERKLLLKTLKNSPVKESQSNTSKVAPSTPILQRSFSSLSNQRKSVDSETSPSNQVIEKPLDLDLLQGPEEIEAEELSESEDYDMAEALSTSTNEPVHVPDRVDAEDTNNVFIDADDRHSSTSSIKDSEFHIFLDSQRVSPLSAISEEPIEEEEIESDKSSDKISENSDSSDSVSSFELISPDNSKLLSSESQESISYLPATLVSKHPVRRVSVSSRDSQMNPSYIKLINQVKCNLQKISAKKYGRIWRDKVREIKKMESFVPLVAHVNMKQYLNIWGHSSVKHNTILNQLDCNKKLCSSVDSLLLFNIFDPSLKCLSFPICEILVKKKLQSRLPFQIMQQSGPIYWKLVISLPSSENSIYDLYGEVESWCEHAFFSSETARNSRIESMVCKGVKVYCKVSVVEGMDKIDSAKNLSALMILRVPGWESSRESQNRLDHMISLSSHPIPVFAINLAPPQMPYVVPPVEAVPYFIETPACSTNFINILTELASNSYLMSVKSLGISDLMNEILDAFLDALQNDCFNSAAFALATKDPTNVIYFYNVLIDKLKNEMVHNYKSNIFGTANEIIMAVTPNSKYNKTSLIYVISDYFDSLKLSKLQWPPITSADLLSSLRNYCDKSGIPQILSHVIRKINPPDEDDERCLSDFMNDLNWLEIMEIVIKGHFRTKFCDLIVTYSEKSIYDVIHSHWWMDCSLILKYCNS